MFLDASAIVAVLRDEPGSVALEQQIESHDGPLFVSALARFEAAMALARAATPGDRRIAPQTIRQADILVSRFLSEIGARDALITADVLSEAVQAAANYGKLVGHPAALNFGDCFAYACAKSKGVSLLYVGNDFARTDLA